MATTDRRRTASGRSPDHMITIGGTGTGWPERGSDVVGHGRISTSTSPRLNSFPPRNARTALCSPITS